MHAEWARNRRSWKPLCSKKAFWFGLDKCQVPTKTALSLALLNRTGERTYDERLEARDKDRERSLTSYRDGQMRLNLGRKGEFNLSPIKSEEDSEKINPDLKRPSLHPSLLPGLNFTPISLPHPPEQHTGMGNGGYSQFITCCLCCSFLLRGRTPQTLPLLQCEVPLTGDSSPQTSSV